jgi:transcriptional regulator with XRE-family HTH domain
MDMRRLVGLNFAKLRKDKGFTQERFAETSGFTQQYVSDLERGRRNPTVVTLFHLASALGVTPADPAPPIQRSGSARNWQSRRAGNSGPAIVIVMPL